MKWRINWVVKGVAGAEDGETTGQRRLPAPAGEETASRRQEVPVEGHKGSETRVAALGTGVQRIEHEGQRFHAANFRQTTTRAEAKRGGYRRENPNLRPEISERRCF
jgi:hypothetical protein